MTCNPISDEARRARNEYAREWRKRNPDKVRNNNKRYWEKKAVEQKKKGANDNAERG